MVRHRRAPIQTRPRGQVPDEAKELEEVEESLPARAEVHWYEAGIGGGKSEEELEMTEGEDNVELDDA